MLRGSLRTGFAPRDYKPANPELWDGCVAAWCPALGPTGHAIHDYTGSGYDGEVKTSGTQMSPVNMWNVDDGDWALTFRNTGSRGDNHVKIRSSSQDMIDPTGQFGVSLWVRRTLDSAFDGFISFGDNFNNSFNLNHQVNDRFSIMCNDQSGLYIFEDSTADRSSDFTWHHLVATSDGSGLTIWVDGVKGDTGAVPTTQSNASAAYLGKMYANDASQHGLTGRLDDIRVYNRPLCDEEIALLGQRRAISYEYALNYHFPATPSSATNVNASVAGAEWDTQAPSTSSTREASVADAEWDTHAPEVEARFKAPDRDADWTLSSGTIDTGDYYDESGDPGIGRLQDCVLRFNMTATNASLLAFEDGKIFHAGDSSGGIWVGVTNNALKVTASDNGGSGSINVNESVFGVFQDGVAKEVMIDVQSGRGNHSENGRVRLFLDGELVDSETTTGGLYLSSGWFTNTSSEYLSYTETSMPHGEDDGSIVRATFGDLDFWAECNVGDATFNGQADSQWDTQSSTTDTEQLATVADAEFDTHAPSVLPVNDATVADAEWDTHAPSTSVGLSAPVADAEWDVLDCTTATEHPSTVSDAEWDTLAPTTQPKLASTVADSEWDTLPCSTASRAEASVSDAEWDTHGPSLVSQNVAPVADAEWDTHAGSITRVVSASVADAEWDTHECEVAAVFLATVAEAEWDAITPSLSAQQSAPVADAEWDALQASLPRAIESTVADAEWDVQPGMLPLRIPSVEADAEWDTQESRFALPYNATLANSNWEARLPFVGPDLTLQAAMSLTARLCPYAGEFLEFANEDAVSGSHKSEDLSQNQMKSGSLSNTEMSGGSLSTAQMIRVGGTTLPTA